MMSHHDLEDDLMQVHERARDLASSWLWEHFHKLRLGVIHVTGEAGVRGILRTGEIRPNVGEFPFSFGQSRTSFATKTGAVSMFDFESASLDEIARTHHAWPTVFFRHVHERKGDASDLSAILDQTPAPVFALQVLDREQLPQDVIRWSDKRPEGSHSDIPYVECWHPGSIPIRAVARCHMVIEGRAWETVTTDDLRHLDLTEWAQNRL